MKIFVDSNCPFCSRHGSYEVRDEKNTILCQGCHRPFELYRDGRVEKSMLYEAMGPVWADDDHGHTARAVGRHLSGVQTREEDMTEYARWVVKMERLSAKGEQ